MRFAVVSLVPLLAAAAAAAVGAPPTTSVTFQIGVPAHVEDQQQPEAVAAQRQRLLATLPGWTHATLEAGHGLAAVSAPLTAGGRLVFANVTAGSYLGEVHSATHIFAPLRVDVEPAGPDAGAGDALRVTVFETYRGNAWTNRGEALRRVAGATAGPTFVVAPLTLATKSYYTERSSFNVLDLLKNPMILLAVVGMGLMVGMPYLVDQMDPEMRAEFEERQKKNPMNSLLTGGGSGGGGSAAGGNFDMAAFLAGSGSGSDKKPGSSSGGGGGGGAGRR